MYAETGEDVFLNPAREPPLREYHPNQPKRTKNIRSTKPTGGVERFDPFHSTQYYAEAEVPTKWVNLLERHMEPKLLNWYEALIAEFAGEVEKERGWIFTKCRFFRDVNKDLTTKAFREIEKKKFWETVLSLNTAMPISFGTWRHGTQWPINKTEEAPGSNECQKRGDG